VLKLDMSTAAREKRSRSAAEHGGSLVRDGLGGEVCESGGIGAVAAPAGERGQRARDRLLQCCRDRRQIEELLRVRACQ
jgi:hypothetical protein